MTDDIVNRLRAATLSGDMPLGQSFDCLAIADEIERLRAAGDALATWAGHADQCIPDDGERCWCGYETASALWEEARRG